MKGPSCGFCIWVDRWVRGKWKEQEKTFWIRLVIGDKKLDSRARPFTNRQSMGNNRITTICSTLYFVEFLANNWALYIGFPTRSPLEIFLADYGSAIVTFLNRCWQAILMCGVGGAFKVGRFVYLCIKFSITNAYFPNPEARGFMGCHLQRLVSHPKILLLSKVYLKHEQSYKN